MLNSKKNYEYADCNDDDDDQLHPLQSQAAASLLQQFESKKKNKIGSKKKNSRNDEYDDLNDTIIDRESTLTSYVEHVILVFFLFNRNSKVLPEVFIRDSVDYSSPLSLHNE
ncbi:hypothetical protein Phum_PHUM067640 [Pediculus humanus corporis]|uniref:Uncharacterized protein n=1 Tax=Pediculus humanus subsp. corporis TaxID=121224 RepID=E0VBS5_PEDHC|nr:uncharacterized protein Phum_PHUM067640 [Pediculus humanus corporis]EEB10831.1 hypothetical protein Phum_PHUM067640 [Pediculus humanus corporis]